MSRGRGEPHLRVLSLGAGVQSSTLYLMAVHGEFGAEGPSIAIFADTQWEPRSVYQWLQFLEKTGGEVLPIIRVTAGSIREAALGFEQGRRSVSLPLYVRNADGSRGILRRQCTREFKLNPIGAAIRHHVGLAKRQRMRRGTRVERWLGISIDEASRMRPSDRQWAENVYPLVDRRMSRRDCLGWLTRHGYAEPPKSACIGCPFGGDPRWRRMRDTSPAEWHDAVAFDHSIRVGLPGLNAPAYVHDSLRPLDEVDLSTAEERGQLDLFENECEGVCGV